MTILNKSHYLWLLLSFLYSCSFEYNNPVDPGSDIYQGFTTAANSTYMVITINEDGLWPELTFSKILDADVYHIQCAEANDFSGELLYDSDALSGNHLTLCDDFLTGNKSYFFRGRAGKAGTWDEWSTVKEFEFKAIEPQYPTGGITVSDNSPVFRWSEYEDAVRYEFQLENGISETVVENRFELNSILSDNQSYRWRVRAINPIGTASAWTRFLEFNIDWGAVEGISPASGSSTQLQQPELSWDKTAGAESYEVQFTVNSDEITAGTVISVTENRYVPDVPLAVPDILYWRVRAVDPAGGYGDWGPNAELNIRPPGIGELYAGGIVFYLDGGGGGLAAAEYDQASAMVWGGEDTPIDTSTVFGTGAANTAAIVAAYGEREPYDNLAYYAAKVCSELELNGYTDWYMPSKDELNVLYQTLGANGIGNFDLQYYWSSSANLVLHAWYQDFTDGRQAGINKDFAFGLRAVRTF